MRGGNPVAGWAPRSFGPVPLAMQTIMQQIVQSDAAIGPAFATAVEDGGFLNPYRNTAPAGSGMTTCMASVAGALLTTAGAPNLIYLEYDEVDTHADQLTRFESFASDFDAAILLLKTMLGDVWADTVVMTMTEFGRTAAANGTGGTDHGTAFDVFLIGGAVAGTGLAGTFPGLSSTQLYQGRDLAPTVDYVAVAKGVLRDHLGLDISVLNTAFPDSLSVTPMSGLVRAGA
jgi:uncharacterized protein (DUF1501 family)